MHRQNRLLPVIVLIVAAALAIGRSAHQVRAKTFSPETNAYAPDFTLRDLRNRPVTLSAVYKKHQVTLVNFWATWCPPCQREIPELNRVYKEYASKSVEILAVNLGEEAGSLRSFAKAYGMSFPILRDKDGKAGELYRVYYIPSTFILDNTGKIRQVIQGGTTYGRLKQSIDRLLREGR